MSEWFQGFELTLSDVKDISEIVFAVVGASIAFLAYRAAKKTVLSPLKTEVLKLQIEALKEVHEYVSLKDPVSGLYDDLFDLREIWHETVRQLHELWYICYCKTHNLTEYEGINTYEDYFFEFYEDKDFLLKVSTNQIEDFRAMRHNGNLSLEWWKSTKLGGVMVSLKYQDYLDKHYHLVSSPWLPTELNRLLDDYHLSIKDTLDALSDARNRLKLNKFDDLDIKHPSDAYKLSQESYFEAGYYNSINTAAVKHNIDKIKQFIKDYLKVNNLMD
jgi:hypothetical protein